MPAGSGRVAREWWLLITWNALIYHWVPLYKQTSIPNILISSSQPYGVFVQALHFWHWKMYLLLFFLPTGASILNEWCCIGNMTEIWKMPHSMSCLCLMIRHSRNWPPPNSVSSCILQTLHLQIITYSVHQVRMLSQLCTVSLIGGNREYVYIFIAWHLSVKLAEVYYPSQDWDFLDRK